jgi:HD-like signal output (HDOD) protein
VLDKTRGMLKTGGPSLKAPSRRSTGGVMKTASHKTTNVFLPFAFKGLKKGELETLYGAATIENFREGTYLFKEGNEDGVLWFIMEGTVRIEKRINGRVREIALLHKGASVEEIGFKKNKKRLASAVAAEPSTVMVLDERGLVGLPPESQISIFRNLNDRATERLNTSIDRERDLCNKNRYLTAYFKEYLQTRKDDYARSEIVQRILKGFPRLPMYASKLAVRLLDEDVSVSEVVNLTKLDPSLVAMVLKTVNSAYYGLQRKISSFQQAVLLLGFNQIYQLVLSNGVRSIMPKAAEFRTLQFHSVIISLLSFEISLLSDLKNGVLHGTIGVLHDLGKSVILLIKKDYPKLEIILDMLGHERIGSLLLKEWDIPDIISFALEYQFFPDFSPPTEIETEHRENVALLYTAHLCEAYMQGKSEEDLYSPFQDEYLDLLGLSEKSVSELVMRNILPSMTKKLNTFPEDVRGFLTQAENRLIGEASFDADDPPIVWNI